MGPRRGDGETGGPSCCGETCWAYLGKARSRRARTHDGRGWPGMMCSRRAKGPGQQQWWQQAETSHRVVLFY